MSKKIIVDANFPNETRVVLLNHNNNIEDIEYETTIKQQNKGNIYLAKVIRVEPALQAAFIDYGPDKSGFLPFTEIHPYYYNIPASDLKSLPSINKLQEISLSDITQDDLVELEAKRDYNLIIDSEEIDLNAIERLVDEKIQVEFNLDVLDNDIETITVEKSDKEEEDKQKQYKIQEVIKKGQVLLVQVTKEERGNKGASFTTFMSLAGKYCVLMPNTPLQNGVSRKISNADERKRLKNIVAKITSGNSSNASSIIIRTAGAGCTTLEVKRDYDYLVRLWNKIRESTLKSIAPCFIHEEDGLIQKVIRDMCDHTVKELIIQGSDAYQNAVKFMKDILPTDIGKLKEYKNKVPIFTKFVVEEQLSKLYQPVFALPSGGYIVINPTEALISIDVNSGKATSERNIEETALKTNLEAAREIARQIKLRDLSGLVVIDFIDMYDARNRRIIERSFKEFLSRDRARIQTANISQFGLLEMSRQRLRPSFLELNSSICSYCNGKGLVRADESNAMLILRTIENEIFNENIDLVNVFANIHSVVYLLNNKRSEISLIEEKYNLKLRFHVDPSATSDNYSIEKIKLPKKSSHAGATSKPLIQNQSSNYQEEKNNKDSSHPNKKKQKWKTSDKLETSSELNKNVEVTIDKEEVNSSQETDKALVVTELDNENVVDTIKSNRKYIDKKSSYTRPPRGRNYNKNKVADNGQSQELAKQEGANS
ncbi:Rne/Rng family ribonuclease [Candidatus Tisiphia endosymbiont of Sialis lutaria]|uniref:Rne/Rng family ribonuclease n=1 Tax=Candidatus Tisiphia endosymbiont of Sialis lutaria TaxID=2029164 RepID=UPI00312CABF8